MTGVIETLGSRAGPEQALASGTVGGGSDVAAPEDFSLAGFC